MVGRIIKGIFQTTEETGDKKKDDWLKTRYFKASKEKVWTEVLNGVRASRDFEIVHESKSVGEISLVHKGLVKTYDVTLTIVAVTPLNVSVDIFSASRGFGGDLGGNYRIVVKLQQMLDKALGAVRVK